MANIPENIKRVKDTIKSTCERTGRKYGDIKLVVVTKSATLEQIKEVIRSGFSDLGENRTQQLRKVEAEIKEFLEQKENSALPDKINWHMVGHLQRNKAKKILPITSLIHSVDTLRLAEEINTSAAKLGMCPDILLQVNSSQEPQKYGAPVGAVTHLAEQIETLPNLRLRGLMTMAPLTRNKDTIRSCFVRTKELFIEMKGKRIVGPQFVHLSMGMSSDYEIAIGEGATILRIGSAIFSA